MPLPYLTAFGYYAERSRLVYDYERIVEERREVLERSRTVRGEKVRHGQYLDLYLLEVGLRY